MPRQIFCEGRGSGRMGCAVFDRIGPPASAGSAADFSPRPFSPAPRRGLKPAQLPAKAGVPLLILLLAACGRTAVPAPTPAAAAPTPVAAPAPLPLPSIDEVRALRTAGQKDAYEN